MKGTGYLGTPLAKKLGLKSKFRVKIVNPPVNYYQLFADWPEDMEFVNDPDTRKDFIHFFVKDAALLSENMKSSKNEIAHNGMIWVSWPKKTSKVLTDITEDVIRAMALKNGLVDIKVCAVDETWSALKLVIPVKDRAMAP